MFRIGNILLIVTLSVNLAFATLPGSGTEADPYRIESKADFNDFAADPNYWDDYTRLDANVSLDTNTYQTAVIAPDTNNATSGFQGTAFTGVFDGNDNCISQWSINTESGKDYLGLVGKVGSSATIKNLGIESCHVSSGTGSECVGCLAGHNSGSIDHCYLIADYALDTFDDASCVGGLVGYNENGNINNSYVEGTEEVQKMQVNANLNASCIGGLVGKSDGGSISYCYSTANVICDENSEYLGGLIGTNRWGTINKCFASGEVVGENHLPYAEYCGGLVGYNGPDCNISDSFALGQVIGDNYVGGLAGYHKSGINRCFSSGAVSGNSNLGGLVGYNNGGSVNNSYWDEDTSGLSYSGGGAGKDTKKMKRKCTFAGWNFTDIWRINENQAYPCLRFHNRADLNTDEIVDFKDLAILVDNWLK